MAKRFRKAPESVSGTFSAMPHSVMDSNAFQGAGHTARSLLFELIRQLTGSNNGHLQLASPWLKRRGWNSADVIQRAKVELCERGLIVMTRQGGMNFGPCLYAVTWLKISNFVGLELSSQDYHPGQWAFMDKMPLIETRSLNSGSRSGESRGPSSGARTAAVPLSGAVASQAAPSGGSNTTLSGGLAVPADGNNVSTNARSAAVAVAVSGLVCRAGRRRPIVGVAGRSGKRAAP